MARTVAKMMPPMVTDMLTIASVERTGLEGSVGAELLVPLVSGEEGYIVVATFEEWWLVVDDIET